MPWNITKKDGKFCVVKEDGTEEGCHDTRAEAVAQQRALYASENKEKSMYYGTYGATSFAEYDQMREVMEERERLGQLHMAFMGIVDNIMWDEEITNKSAAVRAAADEMCRRMDESDDDSHEEKSSDGIVSFLVKAVKSLLHKDAPSQEPRSDGIMFFKDEAGVYQWVARYSNNFRDDDTPAEIISAESHKKYAALVEAGVVTPPDLWYWHVPDWKWGEGQWVAYDQDTGFALAGGFVYPEFNELAESLAKEGDSIGVSHGMPAWSISRDGTDPTVIVEHITEEVSPLPLWAAANKLTQFSITKETDMALSKEDKARLSGQFGVSPELLAKLEERNLADAQKAAALGRDSKEATTDQPEDGATGAAAETEPTQEAQEPEAPTAEGDVAIADIKELGSVMATALNGVLALSERVDALTKELEALKASDAEKVAKQAAVSPLASLAALVQKSVVGDDAARVDGRTALGRSAPEETQPPAANGPYPFPIVNDLIAGRWGNK